MTVNTNSTTNLPQLPESGLATMYAAWTCMTESPWECTKNYALNKLSSFTYETAKWTTFHGSDYFASSTGNLAVWSVKSLASATLSVPEWLMTKALPSTEPSFAAIRDKAEQTYNTAANTFAGWTEQATNYITPNAKTLHLKKVKELIPGETAPAMFSAASLVGPAIVLRVCMKKSTANAFDAFRHFRLLVTGNRREVISYNAPVQTNNTQKESSVTFFRVTNYTTAGLMKDVTFEAVFAALWAKGAHMTYEAIFDALKGAGNSDADAKMAVNAILIGVTVAPTLYKWAMHAAFDPHDPDHDQNVSTGPFNAKIAIPAFIREAMDKIDWPDRLKLNPYEGISPATAA